MRFGCVGVFEGAQFYPAGPCWKLQWLLEILAHSNVVHPDIHSRISRTAMGLEQKFFDLQGGRRQPPSVTSKPACLIRFVRRTPQGSDIGHPRTSHSCGEALLGGCIPTAATMDNAGLADTASRVAPRLLRVAFDQQESAPPVAVRERNE